MRYKNLVIALALSIVTTSASAATVKKGYAGCTSTALLARLEQLGASGDDVAMLEFYRVMMGAKQCTVFSIGDTVYLETDPHLNSSYVRIRKQGSPISYITRKDTIK